MNSRKETEDRKARFTRGNFVTQRSKSFVLRRAFRSTYGVTISIGDLPRLFITHIFLRYKWVANRLNYTWLQFKSRD